MNNKVKVLALYILYLAAVDGKYRKDEC